MAWASLQLATLRKMKSYLPLTTRDCHGGIVWQCSCGSARCRGTIVSSFFELPVELQLEYLPLLNEWFIEEHRSKVDALRKILGVKTNESSSS